jgi:hypothetical protein
MYACSLFGVVSGGGRRGTREKGGEIQTAEKRERETKEIKEPNRTGLLHLPTPLSLSPFRSLALT